MTAKIFQHGDSQAVRLPRVFRMAGTEVKISRTARGVLLEPLESDFEAKRKAFFALAGSCPDLADVPPHTISDVLRDE